jgi:hypothetical protein
VTVVNHKRCTALERQEGVRVHSDSPHADQWRRYWTSIGQQQPACSQRDGYYLQALPSLLPSQLTDSAA